MNRQYAHLTFYVIERNAKVHYGKSNRIKESLFIWFKGIFPLFFLRNYQYEKKYEIVTYYRKC